MVNRVGRDVEKVYGRPVRRGGPEEEGRVPARAYGSRRELGIYRQRYCGCRYSMPPEAP